MKELKDYLHLYLPFEFIFNGYKYQVIGFKDCGHFFQIWHLHGFLDVLKEDFKLPLRPLSDMRKEEREHFGWQDDNDFKELFIDGQISKNVYHAWMFPELLSKHFDLFGLIEAGLAIDKTTLKQQS